MPLTIIHTMTDDLLRQLHELFQNEWWTRERALEDTIAAIEATPFLFALVDEREEQLVAFARVLSDCVFKALIMDVVVRPGFRDQGCGTRIMESIAGHPELKDVQHFELYCLEEMMPYYERWGFTAALGEVRFMRSDSFGRGR